MTHNIHDVVEDWSLNFNLGCAVEAIKLAGESKTMGMDYIHTAIFHLQREFELRRKGSVLARVKDELEGKHTAERIYNELKAANEERIVKQVDSGVCRGSDQLNLQSNKGSFVLHDINEKDLL